jgi:hypothetical protein
MPRNHFEEPPSGWKPRRFPPIGAYGQGSDRLAHALGRVVGSGVHGHVESIPVDGGERVLFMVGLIVGGLSWTWQGTYEEWEVREAIEDLLAAFNNGGRHDGSD